MIPQKTVILPMVFSLLQDIQKKENHSLLSVLSFLNFMEHVVIREEAASFAPHPSDPEFLRQTILPKVIRLNHALRTTPTQEPYPLEEAAADITDMQLAIWAYLKRREVKL